jgi:hypothetical protein
MPGETAASTFVLTAIAATADAVPGDQVNLHKLQPCARHGEFMAAANPPAACLDPRNETGWSPTRLGSRDPTATFGKI